MDKYRTKNMTTQKEYHNIQLKNTTLTYLLERKPVKNINLRIKSDGSVCVSANNRVPVWRIEDFIIEKQNYIERAIREYSRKNTQELASKQYVNGETFGFLGKSLCLKVKEAETERVETDETYLYLYLKQTENFTKKERLVQQWFKEQTVQVFSEIIESIYPQFEKYGVPYPKITIRSMTSRWGSCQPVKARITLNAWLIATPKECIEYVVVHEFAHFIHPNHSKQFWAFVESMMPDYRERKTMLRGYGTR